MSSENQQNESENYVRKSIKFWKQVTTLWWRWRNGIVDDGLEGVELGTVRPLSCPSLTRLPKEPATMISPFEDSNCHLNDLDFIIEKEKETHQQVKNSVMSLIPTIIVARPPSPLQEEKSTPHDSSLSMSYMLPEDYGLSTSPPFTVSFTAEEEEDFHFLIRFASLYLNEEDQLEVLDLPKCFDRCSQGVIPCLLLNALVPDMVDVRALNLPSDKEKLKDLEKKQNHILCVNSLASIAHIQEKDKIDPVKLAKRDKDAIFHLLHTIIDVTIVKKIDVHNYPQLRALQEDEEDIFHFLQQSPQDLLLRWINHRISKDGTENAINNLSEDLNDCSIFLALLHESNSDLFQIDEALQISDLGKRAELVLSKCAELGIKTSHLPNDLLSEKSERHCILLAQMFMSIHGLEMQVDSVEDLATDVEEFVDEGSREERTFRMWMNSLGCETSCQNLFSEEFRTGWMLLEVLDSIQSKCIDWTKAFKPPFKPIVKRIKSVENCNQVIQVAKERLHLSLVGIGGDDIADGKRKPTLALVWQLLRVHTLMVLHNVLESSSTPTAALQLKPSYSWKTGEQDKTKLNETDVLAWANHMLDMSGSKNRISSFRDPSLSNGLALLDLLKTIEPNAVQDKHVTNGVTAVEKELNAKYVLSISRKLGASVFIVWEDIVEVMPKMILLLIASFMLIEKQRRKMHRAATINNRLSRTSFSS